MTANREHAVERKDRVSLRASARNLLDELHQRGLQSVEALLGVGAAGHDRRLLEDGAGEGFADVVGRQLDRLFVPFESVDLAQRDDPVTHAQ
jgi:hypothetical protein